MSLELSLQIILIIIDDSLIGNRDKDLLSLGVGQVMDTIENVIVETKGPLQLQSAGLAQFGLLLLVLTHVSYKFNLNLFIILFKGLIHHHVHTLPLC